MDSKITIEVSARHIHLSQNDLEALFGAGYQLKKQMALTQPEDFSAEETLTIENNGRKIENIRIVGPVRENTQIELSKTDAIYLKIDPPIRLSGDVLRSAGLDLIGPAGKISIDSGVIISWRHIHCNNIEAENIGIKNGDIVSVEIEGDRGVIFKNVKVRAGDNYKLAMHIDTDEGNAAGINKTGIGIILK